MKLSQYSYPISMEGIISHDDYYTLLKKADELYGILTNLYELYQQTLDLNIRALYTQQLMAYSKQIEEIQLCNPELIELRRQEILEQAARLWAGHTLAWEEKVDADGNKIQVTVNNEDNLATEVIAKHVFLLDIARALGWEPPQPQIRPVANIPCFKSLRQFTNGEVEKVGYCEAAQNHILSSCIYEPNSCPLYEEH